MEAKQGDTAKFQATRDLLDAPDQWPRIKSFLETIRDDPRITVFHISIYISLLYEWELQGFAHPLRVHGADILTHAKISSPATWHKCVRALNEWGYLEYKPSYSTLVGSLVTFKKHL